MKARKNESLGDYLRRNECNAEVWCATSEQLDLDRVMDARFLDTARGILDEPLRGGGILVFEQADGVLLLVEVVWLDALLENGKPIAIIRLPEQAEKYDLDAPDWLADVYARLRTLRPTPKKPPPTAASDQEKKQRWETYQRHVQEMDVEYWRELVAKRQEHDDTAPHEGCNCRLCDALRKIGPATS